MIEESLNQAGYREGFSITRHDKNLITIFKSVSLEMFLNYARSRGVLKFVFV